MKEKLANFWYHYKWHTIVALFLVAVILFCTLQTCRKDDDYDLVMIYAGPHVMSANETRSAKAALSAVDADTSLDLYHYLVDFGAGSTGASYEGLTNFDAEVQSGEGLIFLVSPALYQRLAEQSAVVALDGYVPQEASVLYVDDTHRGILFSSLPLSENPAFSGIPDDTVLCFRGPVSVGAFFRRRRAEERYKTAEEYLKKLCSASSSST